MRSLLLIALSLIFLATASTEPRAPAKTDAPANQLTNRDAAIEPAYDADGKLLPPMKYREWVFLSSGIDMSYSPKAGMMDHSMFDNVFVNPAAYRSFVKTGTWPDKTVLVLEIRGAESKGSINRSGHFQSGEGLMGFEVHVKDEAKTPGKWAFYEFDNEKPAEQIPVTAACYSCHEQHAAVATTFVQFYPTLLPIAKQKNTLSQAFLKEMAADGK